MRINSQFNRIPTDSDASIMTSGLLGGQYIGITAGGAEEFLKQGDRIEFVQDAFVLENLINQLAATFSGVAGSDSRSRTAASRRRRKQRSRSMKSFVQSFIGDLAAPCCLLCWRLARRARRSRRRSSARRSW